MFDQFLIAQKAGDRESVRILDRLQLRYFSPNELLRLFSFSQTSPLPSAEPSFIWPPEISKKTRYKLIGNSVNVAVIAHLIEYLFR